MQLVSNVHGTRCVLKEGLQNTGYSADFTICSNIRGSDPMITYDGDDSTTVLLQTNFTKLVVEADLTRLSLHVSTRI